MRARIKGSIGMIGKSAKIWHATRLLGLMSALWLGLALEPAASQELAIAPTFDRAGVFNEGAAPVRQGKKWGMIGRDGEWILKPAHAEIGPGGDGLFAFLEKGRWGYLDAKGRVRIRPQFDEARPFEDGLAAVKAKGLWGFARPDGSMQVPFRFREVGSHQDGRASARDEEGWAVFNIDPSQRDDRDAVAIYDPVDGVQYPQRIYSVSEGAVVALYADGERLIDVASPHWRPNRISDAFASVKRRSEGFAAISRTKERWGYLHKSGKLFWDGRFEDAMVFADGYAPVKLDGKWGYISHAGDMAVEPVYDAAFPFREGYAVIRQGERRGFLKTGPDGRITQFIPPRYDDAFRFSEGLAPVLVGDKWGYVSDPYYRRLVVGEIVELVPE